MKTSNELTILADEGYDVASPESISSDILAAHNAAANIYEGVKHARGTSADLVGPYVDMIDHCLEEIKRILFT